MLTEDEARKKWCPFTRVGNEAGCNRNQRDFEGKPLCIASDCMAWHYIVPDEDWEKITKEIEAEGQSNYEPRYGFCGLAGKP